MSSWSSKKPRDNEKRQVNARFLKRISRPGDDRVSCKEASRGDGDYLASNAADALAWVGAATARWRRTEAMLLRGTPLAAPQVLPQQGATLASGVTRNRIRLMRRGGRRARDGWQFVLAECAGVKRGHARLRRPTAGGGAGVKGPECACSREGAAKTCCEPFLASRRCEGG